MVLRYYRGHFITNPNIAFFEGEIPRNNYHTFALCWPPEVGNSIFIPINLDRKISPIWPNQPGWDSRRPESQQWCPGENKNLQQRTSVEQQTGGLFLLEAWRCVFCWFYFWRGGRKKGCVFLRWLPIQHFPFTKSLVTLLLFNHLVTGQMVKKGPSQQYKFMIPMKLEVQLSWMKPYK